MRAEGSLIRYYGVRAFDELVEACRSADPQVRFRAVWALAHTKAPEAYETILDLMHDPDERVMFDAAVALGIHGNPRAADVLFDLSQQEGRGLEAGMGLARLGLSALPAIERAMVSNDAEDRLMGVGLASRLVEDTSNERCWDLLRRATDDSDSAVALEARHAFSEFYRQEGGSSRSECPS